MEEYKLHKRDVSWLAFNHRVLQEASDKRVPLFERINFMAIYSSNLDEFFRVRVAALRQFKKLAKSDRKELLDIKPKKDLKEIQEIVHNQQIELGAIFRDEILPGLQQQQIELYYGTLELPEVHIEFARQFFDMALKELLHPVYLKKGEELPFLKNRKLYLLVTFAASEELALLPIPADEAGRFIQLPPIGTHHYLAFLDDIIRKNLDRIFDKKVQQAYSIKASRDAELYIDDEYSGDLVEKIRNSLDQRDTGLPTRLLYDSSMPPDLVNRLKEIFQLKKNDLFPGGRYHNFNDFFGLPDPTGKPELHNKPLPPLPHPDLENAASIREVLLQKDVMLHFPYQKYDYVPRFIDEAADDPQTEYIKITLYRVASKSAVVSSLLTALKKGKKVVAFIEAKARFDDASNLYWGKELENAGAKVLYSYPGIKVHSKLLLIGRREDEGIKHYAYLGTGNFNEKTAKLYCDHALLTSDTRLADEVNQVFGVLEKNLVIPKTKHLFVSPFTTRTGFDKLIDREIELAQTDKEAYMILKMNSLEDKAMIQHLYQASQAGVKITLLVRGICCLVPGVPGMSENIQVYSIVDRFLEHARVYIFGNNGKEKMYTASADWMTRNLDRRVEVGIPIYDPAIYKELRDIINIQLADNTKSRIINATLTNPYRQDKPGSTLVRAQEDIYAYLQKK